MDIAIQVVDPTRAEAAAAPHNAVNLVSLVQQKFRQIRPILSRDASDNCSLGHG
jgi:hypothetical protein